MTSYDVPFDLAFPGQANGAGSSIISAIGPARPNQTWIIEQISISGTVPAGAHALASISVNGLFKLGSRTGELDTASQDPPLTLQPGETMSCVWAGLTPNTATQLRLTGRQRFQ